METGLLVLGNYFPTGDLDRLVKKHGPGKMNRSGNLDRVAWIGLGSLTTIAIVRLFSVLIKCKFKLPLKNEKGDPVVPSHSYSMSNISKERKTF